MYFCPGISADGYCDALDLTTRVPESIVSSARAADRLVTLDLSEPSTSAGVFQPALEKIQKLAESRKLSSYVRSMWDHNQEHLPKHVSSNHADVPREAVRLSIPDLGDPSWGDVSSRVCLFLESFDSHLFIVIDEL